MRKQIFLVSFLTILGIFMQVLADSKENRAHVLALCNEIEETLSECSTLEEKTEQLQQDLVVINTLQKHPEVSQFLSTANSEQTYVLAIAAALQQFDAAFEGFEHLPNKQAALSKFVSTLVRVDQFYEPLGGLLGYHRTFLSLLDEKQESTAQVFLPPYTKIQTPTKDVWKLCFEGCKNLDKTAFIFPVGGAGDRLGLINKETQEPQPAACQLFCGRSLFSGLIRDALAQEYWYYRSFGKQLQIPIIVMSSQEKNNDHYIQQMWAEADWFERPKDKVRRIVQPLVPLIDLNGAWVVTAPLELALKPGGHGVIWKLSQDSGAFHWLKRQNIEHTIVRQINNPLAALDYSLFALGGYGATNRKAFGFLSCPSRPGMAEGLNVLSVRDSKATISNIEYTHFACLKEVMPHLFKEGAFPANTNVIYANVQGIEKALRTDPFPGMVVNAKTTVSYEKNGEEIRTQAGRLESSMQNMTDAMLSSINPKNPTTPEDLSTFLLLQNRDKFFSVAKNAFTPGKSSKETPQAALFDWNTSLCNLLEDECHFTIPKRQTVDEFIKDGPAITFNFHPALGPIWTVISQKLSHGTIQEKSELELEIAEISCHNLRLDGSLRVLAKEPLGSTVPQQGVSFGPNVGRARLNNVSVTNKGIKDHSVDHALYATFEREESCSIILEGFSEVEADGLSIIGPFHLVVPDGQRAHLTQEPSGEITTTFESISQPSWQYSVEWNPDSAPQLKLQERKLG